MPIPGIKRTRGINNYRFFKNVTERSICRSLPATSPVHDIVCFSAVKVFRRTLYAYRNINILNDISCYNSNLPMADTDIKCEDYTRIYAIRRNIFFF